MNIEIPVAKLNEHGVAINAVKIFSLKHPKHNRVEASVSAALFNDGIHIAINCTGNIWGSSGPVSLNHSQAYGSYSEARTAGIKECAKRFKDATKRHDGNKFDEWMAAELECASMQWELF